MLGVLTDFIRYIFFQPLKGDISRHWRLYLFIGLLITWVVGIGRTWDYDAAPWWLRTGLPSVAYVFTLAAIIWTFTLALRPARWSYRNVLLMVAMTAPPGLIYAIPVERFLDPDSAQSANMLALLLVATWRMALFYRFLTDVAQLPKSVALIAWLLPPALIIAPISLLGLMAAVLQSMSGVREDVGSSGLSADAIALIAFVSWTALPLLIIAYIVTALKRNRTTDKSLPPPSSS